MVYIASSRTARIFDGAMGAFCAAHYSEMAVTWQRKMALQNGCKLMHTAAGAAERYDSALQYDFHCQTAAQTL